MLDRMSEPVHHEWHLKSTDSVRDVVIGMSDGLTVPFALAAGLSGAHVSTHVVVLAGLAEIAAGCIAMGLGGYLAARTDAEHYEKELRREYEETRDLPEEEAAEVARVFQGWGLADHHVEPLVQTIVADEKRWVDFMMRFELGLERPDKNRAHESAFIIGISYVIGGLIPLSAYFLTDSVTRGLESSVVLTLGCLIVFGIVKSKLTGQSLFKGALRVTIVGALAAAAAFGLAKMIA